MARGSWFERLPLGEPTRRALEETMADGAYERRQARTASARAAAAVATIAAATRAVLLLVGLLEDGYPMRNLGRDFTYAIRRLRSAPAFTIFSVLTLAIGIGATTAMTSIVRSVTGPPPGVAQPERVVHVSHAPGFNYVNSLIGWADFQDYKASQRSFASLTAWTRTSEAIVVNGRSESGFGEIVEGSYFSVLGVQPAIGRLLQPTDDRPSAPPVAVISDLLWRRDFDSAPTVVGRTVVVNGVTVPIVGVAAASFQGLVNGGLVPSALWLPVSAAPLMNGPGIDFPLDGDRDRRWLTVMGRLDVGKTFDQAQAEARVIAGQLDAAYPLGSDLDARWRRFPELVSRRWTLHLLTDTTRFANTDEIMPLLVTTVFVSIGLVLLVACTNLANLTIARGTARRRDLAVRLAIGATRWRLVREEVTENALVILAGAAAGFLLAIAILARLRTDVEFGPSVIHLTPTLDRAAFLAGLAASGLALVVAGIVPAWLSTRADLRSAIGTDAAGAALPRWRGRRWLIAMQVAISLLFLSLAAISAEQVRHELHRDTGLSLDRLAIANVAFAEQRVDDAHARQLAEQIVAILDHDPGVTMAAVTTGLPFGASNPGSCVATLERPIVPDKFCEAIGELIATTPGGLRTIGVQILNGRPLTDRDTETSASVAVISVALAKKVFGTTEVVGREMQVQARRWAGMPMPPTVTRTIVGVASDTDEFPGRPGALTVYLPLAQQLWGRLTFVARTDGDPATLVPALRRAISAVAPTIATSEIGTATSVTGVSDGPLKVLAGVAALLGTFALVLSLVGLYGVLSHVVGLRVREMGVRVALGASTPQIVRLILGDGLRPVAYGVLFGLGAGAIARMALRPIFIRMVPTIDPLTLTLAPAAIIVAGWIACYIPARRASRVDPNIALRDL